MKNNILYYSVGALLYCPAYKKSIADAVIHEEFGTKYSLALCLEDTVNDRFVEEAEQILIRSIQKIHNARKNSEFYLPQIFIRVRCPQQITKLTAALGESGSLTLLFNIISHKSSV